MVKSWVDLDTKTSKGYRMYFSHDFPISKLKCMNFYLNFSMPTFSQKVSKYESLFQVIFQEIVHT